MPKGITKGLGDLIKQGESENKNSKAEEKAEDWKHETMKRNPLTYL